MPAFPVSSASCQPASALILGFWLFESLKESRTSQGDAFTFEKTCCTHVRDERFIHDPFSGSDVGAPGERGKLSTTGQNGRRLHQYDVPGFDIRLGRRNGDDTQDEGRGEAVAHPSLEKIVRELRDEGNDHLVQVNGTSQFSEAWKQESRGPSTPDRKRRAILRSG